MGNENIQSGHSVLSNGVLLQAGKYKIERALASGGFGNTYEITNITFGDRFALKEFYMKDIALRDENSTTISVPITENKNLFEAHKEKFKREARFLRKLKNKHIVQVHDLFDENGTAYYVMDYIEGLSLSAYMKQCGMALQEAEVRNILMQMLDALEEIHAQKIWHLDIKPANIMRENDGNVILIDFGASKQLGDDGAVTLSTTSFSYTQGYAPAEQISQNRKLVGAWTDFYSLGATLFNLLTNSKPPTFMELSEGEPLVFNTPVSPQMQQLVKWMMSTSTKRRPQTVAQIRAFLNGAPVPQPVRETPVASPQVSADEEKTIVSAPVRPVPQRPVTHSQPNVDDDRTMQANYVAPANNSAQYEYDYEDNENNKKWTLILGGAGIAFALILVLMFAFCGSDNRSEKNDIVAIDSLTVDSIVTGETNIEEKIEDPVKKDEQSDKLSNDEKGTMVDNHNTLTQKDLDDAVIVARIPEDETTTHKEPVQSTKIFDVVEQQPSFNGDLNGYLARNIKYPVVAQENGIQGRVVVKFVVERDGSITDVHVVRSVDKSLDAEAVRLVKAMPRWNPGRQNGQTVRTYFTLPVNFRLQ